jgi:nitrite reductase (NADH) small subunit
MAVGRFVVVASAEDVPPGETRIVNAGERQLALFNVDGRFYATQSQCLDLNGPLGDGELDGLVVTCPWHGWQYDVRTGENELDRALQRETVEVVVEDRDVKVVL